MDPSHAIEVRQVRNNISVVTASGNMGVPAMSRVLSSAAPGRLAPASVGSGQGGDWATCSR